MRWLMGLWYAHCRRLDVQLLWPSCKAGATSLDYAKCAFALHAVNDRAWQVLGGDEIVRRVDALE